MIKIGNIYDGRWEVIRFEPYGTMKSNRSGRYVLKNIYNEEEITIKDERLRQVDKGERTLSSILSNKIKNGKVDKKKTRKNLGINFRR